MRSKVLDVLRSDCEKWVASVGGGVCENIAESFGEIRAPCVRVRLPDALELLLIASDAYPGTPPIALVTCGEGETEQLYLYWDISCSADSRLARGLDDHILPPAPFRKVYGPSGALPMTGDPVKAAVAGWPRFFSGAAVRDQEATADLFTRSRGILSEELRQRSVFVVGLGSGGSYVANHLARVGVGALHILDSDSVEGVNLARTTYTLGDLGRPKAEALARQVLNINPKIEVIPYVCEVADLGANKLKEIILASDLILPLTDDPKAQSVLNHFSYYLGKPAIFASIYRGAQGGEVILSIPNETPCYQCSVGQRRSVGEDVEREVDYGTERLVGEIALGADIQHIDSATVKTALSILLRGSSSASLAGFAAGAIQRGFTFLTMSTVPDYWMFPFIFAETQGQYGYQSVWLSPSRDEQCHICGKQDRRSDPAEFPLRRVRSNRHSHHTS